MFEKRRPLEDPQGLGHSRYPAGMTVSAYDVAVVLRERLPGLPTTKLHKLLYYCQGHHLAAFDEPLFHEAISAWDMGPVVGPLYRAERTGEPTPIGAARLSEAQLNTIGYVVSRYGALSGTDLKNLTHREDPWRLADASRRPHESVTIKIQWLADYFQSQADDDEDEAPLDSAVVTAWLQDAAARRSEEPQADNIESLRARLSRG